MIIVSWALLWACLPSIQAWRFAFEKDNDTEHANSVFKIGKAINTEEPKACARLKWTSPALDLKVLRTWAGGSAGRPPMAVLFYGRGNQCKKQPNLVAVFYNSPDPWETEPRVMQVLDFQKLANNGVGYDLTTYTSWEEIAPGSDKWDEYVRGRRLVPGDVAYNSGQGPLRRQANVIDAYEDRNGRMRMISDNDYEKLDLYDRNGEAYGEEEDQDSNEDENELSEDWESETSEGTNSRDSDSDYNPYSDELDGSRQSNRRPVRQPLADLYSPAASRSGSDQSANDREDPVKFEYQSEAPEDVNIKVEEGVAVNPAGDDVSSGSEIPVKEEGVLEYGGYPNYGYSVEQDPWAVYRDLAPQEIDPKIEEDI